MAFNRFVPFLSLAMNNRDHRKILVIDGHTAYNGGINLADEYINRKMRFGHWKDTGVRIHGEAVQFQHDVSGNVECIPGAGDGF